MTIKEIKSQLEKEGIRLYKTEVLEEFYDRRFIKFADYEEYICFLKDNDIQNVFYFLDHIATYNHIIEYDMYCGFEGEYSEKQYKKIEDEVSKYNENLIDSELFRNKFINLLAIYNNIYFMYIVDEDKYVVPGPEEALNKIIKAVTRKKGN